MLPSMSHFFPIFFSRKQFLRLTAGRLGFIGGVLLSCTAAFSQIPQIGQLEPKEKEWRIYVDSSSYYLAKHDLPNALRCATQAQQFAYKQYGENTIGYIAFYKLMAQAYYRNRDFKQAVYHGEEFIRRLKKIPDPPHSISSVNRQYSEGLRDLAEIYKAIGKIELAEQTCLECMKANPYGDPQAAVSSIFLQPVLLDYLGCKSSLADIYAFNGKQTISIQMYDEVVKLLKECLPKLFLEPYKNKAEYELCATLNNLGFVQTYMGNYYWAELAYKDACLIAEESFKRNSLLKDTYIVALTNLARMLSDLNQTTEVNRYMKTLETLAKEGYTDGLLKANLASLSGSLSPDERIAMQKEALLLFGKAKDITNTADTQLGLAINLVGIGRYDEAKKYLHQADQNQPSITGYSTAIWSSLALAQKKPRKAMRLLNKAIKTYPSQDAQYPILWERKAVISAQLKNIAAAKSAEETALKLMNQRIQTYFPYLSEQQREQYLDAYDTYREYYFSLSCLNKRDSTTTGKLYDLVLSSKGVLLEAVRQTKAGISNTTDTLLNKKQTRYSYSKNLLARYYQSGQKEAWMNIDSLEAETEVLEKEISRTAMATQRPKTTWQQIRAALKPNEAAVEIVRFRLYDETQSPQYLFGSWRDSVYYAALILRSASPAPELVLLPNGKALEETHLKAYRTDVERRTYDADSYSQFWQPIQEKIGGAKTIYFSPDGVYHQINLGTLRNTGTGYFLSEEIDIRLVGSTRTLMDTLKIQPKYTTIALFGYPDYQQVSDSQKKDSVVTITYYKRPDLERGGNQFQPLRWTKDEVESIQNIAIQQGWTSHLFTEGRASEENVKKIKNTTILHIATHGYFLKDTSKVALTKRALLNAGLVLAGAMDSTRKGNQRMEDGLLTAYEVAGLPLKGTELVTLSACETGLGLIRNGNGVFGLQQAFFAAGAENVLISLWRVNDLVTKELMEKFYHYWFVNRLTKQEALSKAQKDIRDTSVQFSHPYYWGGFVLIRQ